ncbi:fibronectin type III domain-containing protein [Desulfosporosinus sp. FKB]|uniref:fibronectin type III domain-containing protein n=1 Tax=Desulfosporosinus sp. FKB TaxID=1969835 RepID=UPI000B4A3F3C|nr:fibronectin type III domain-containing protein [Desulfosporosinus sp. FKB]
MKIMGKGKAILIVLIVLAIIAVSLVLVLWKQRSVPQNYTSVRYLAPLPNSEQQAIQNSLDDFWHAYSLQNTTKGDEKDPAPVPKSESINSISSETNSTTDTTTKLLYPGIPQGLVTVPLSNSSIKLSWDPAPYASTYNVYRSTNQERGYRKIANEKDPEYVDTGLNPSTEYFYKISSVKSSGVESYFANPVGAVTNASDASAPAKEKNNP